MQAATINILNPNPYLGWSLVLGPAVLAAWRQNSMSAVVLIIAFYTTMVTVLACTIFLFGTTRFLGSAGRHKLILISVVTLAILGAYQITAALLKGGAA
jgi:threonine/homoserine/homoserine lactone efflux protein